MPNDCKIHDARPFVGGRTLETPTHPVYNPARYDEVVGWSALADATVVDGAVRAAAEVAGAWAELDVPARKAALRGAALAALADFDERATLLTREQGKVLWESNVDLAGAPYLLHECSRLIARVAEEELVDNDAGRFIRRRRPVGVVGVIVPWNYPIVLAFNAIAPALAAGNTVVVKPSELAPLALTAVLTAVAAALPDGVLNIVPGTGAQAGHALASHPLVRRIMFTGGPVSGREVMRAAADTITGVGLELGGNDPALVLESSIIDDDLIGALRHSVFTCSGQVCFAIKRIYVHRSHFHELVGAFADAVNELRIGDGLDPRSSIGPLISAAALERVQGLLDDAREIDATVTALGAKVDPSGWDRGHFLLPHLVTGIPHTSRLVGAEQFGPVVPIIPFDVEDHAIAMANDSEFGLAASVWSRDDDHAFDVARRIEAGTVFVNVHRAGASDHTTPFGGVKQSGIGRSNGWASIEELTETQMLIRRDDATALPGPPAAG
jgi:aldehyde dehydrogenase